MFKLSLENVIKKYDLKVYTHEDKIRNQVIYRFVAPNNRSFRYVVTQDTFMKTEEETKECLIKQLFDIGEDIDKRLRR